MASLTTYIGYGGSGYGGIDYGGDPASNP